MEVKLRRISGSLFEAKNAAGNVSFIDGPESVGGKNAAIRPMENVLVALAGCSAVDVLLILQKGRHDIDDLDIAVKGERTDSVPAVFESIHLAFTASGSFNDAQLERACALSMEKYCSVATMLAPTVRITHEAVKKVS